MIAARRVVTGDGIVPARVGVAGGRIAAVVRTGLTCRLPGR